MKTVVITGAGGVLCGTLAKALAKQGYQIALLDLKKEAADKVAEEINVAGGKAIGVAANVLERDSLEAAKKEVNEKFGSCDILYAVVYTRLTRRRMPSPPPALP